MIPKNLKDVVYVGCQLLLFLVYILWNQPILSIQLPEFSSYIAWFLIIFSAGLFSLALWNIRYSLSPYPTPKQHAELQTNGAFAFSRHPIYSSIFIGLLAWGVLQENINQVITALVLLVFFYIKASYEESLLTEKFEAYKNYQKTTGMLFPRLVSIKST